jgi:hypothetical protein
MKKIIIIALALFVAHEASAQSKFKFGVKGGWDFENFDIGGSVGEQLKKENSTSWNLGAVAQIGLGGSFYIQPEILYSSQKIEMSYPVYRYDSAFPIHVYDPNTKISYFQVPVNLLYKFDMPAITPFVSGGVYFGYAVNISGHDIGKGNIKKTDWGVSLGAGVEFWKLQVTAKYNWALQDISDASGLTWKNNKFNVSVAFFIL